MSTARALVDVISGKWDLAVMIELWPESRRHAELGRATGVERKQLTRVLRRLESSGLVDRTVEADSSPVRVRYGLTTRGRELLRGIDEVARWWAAGGGVSGGAVPGVGGAVPGVGAAAKLCG
ncbi:MULTISPECIES: helix-turn-helix domain-containing protein [unclassified Streptomyces]|uniref:winged helix-turn-helix transcriptional regulator n=1 Tax=unclassified Streptomyces TaxID=2593676 RepID=UPI00278C16AE|nr:MULTISPECIES: helix-turn-helix domain-containing protein [unclassified Streptomyces]